VFAGSGSKLQTPCEELIYSSALLQLNSPHSHNHRPIALQEDEVDVVVLGEARFHTKGPKGRHKWFSRGLQAIRSRA